jgi:DNA-binding MarR family transcriptional regulator
MIDISIILAYTSSGGWALGQIHAGNQEKSIGKWISVLHRQAQIYLNRELKPYGLNSSEYIYLVNLAAENDGVNQKRLSDTLIIDRAFTARAMKSLENKGYIVRKRSRNDKRSYNIRLTEKGTGIQPVILAILKRWTGIISEGMNEEEKDSTIQRLMAMSTNALKATKEQ